jgi:hypothetical protein
VTFICLQTVLILKTKAFLKIVNSSAINEKG